MAAGGADGAGVLGLASPEWKRRMEDVHFTKRDLNELVMNFFVLEGYGGAASAFAAESGTSSTSISTTSTATSTPTCFAHSSNRRHTASLPVRADIRTALHAGLVDRAVEAINDYDSEVLERQPELYFRLQLQKLLELILTASPLEVVDFARTELTPYAAENPEFLVELERSMSLLAFSDPTALLQAVKKQHLLCATLLESKDRDSSTGAPADIAPPSPAPLARRSSSSASAVPSSPSPSTPATCASSSATASTTPTTTATTPAAAIPPSVERALGLLGAGHRAATASRVNSALLNRPNAMMIDGMPPPRPVEARLQTLLRILVYIQDALSVRSRPFPRLSSLGPVAFASAPSD